MHQNIVKKTNKKIFKVETSIRGAITDAVHFLTQLRIWPRQSLSCNAPHTRTCKKLLQLILRLVATTLKTEREESNKRGGNYRAAIVLGEGLSREQIDVKIFKSLDFQEFPTSMYSWNFTHRFSSLFRASMFL